LPADTFEGSFLRTLRFKSLHVYNMTFLILDHYCPLTKPREREVRLLAKLVYVILDSLCLDCKDAGAVRKALVQILQQRCLDLIQHLCEVRADFEVELPQGAPIER